MAAGTFSASRRRNVSPTTSILHTFVEDVDCTGTDFTYAPEDGQMITVAGRTGHNNHGSVWTSATAAAVTQEGASLRMVWGSALRSDRSALGQKRVPVFKKGDIRVKLKLFDVADDSVNPTSNGYIPGALVSVRKSRAAVEGTADRLVVCLADGVANKGEYLWSIGHVERVTNDIVGAGAEIEIYLYSEPRFIVLPLDAAAL